MIFMAFYRNIVVPTKSEDIVFEEFLKELPADYSEMAYEFKAFTRSRKIKTPAQLLQVVMLYCGLDHVLRETAGVFTLQEDRITDTAIHKRLKACTSASTSLRFLVVDGSSLQGPGAQGNDYRLHLALDLVNMTLHELDVTGADQGESLNRYGFTPGDVVMVDRGYNHPATIIDLYEQEVGVVVRLLPTAMPLYLRPADQPEIALPAELRLTMADYLRTATGDCVSIPVWLSSKGRCCPGMVHAQRLPPEAAEAARRRCRQDGNRKGRTPAQDTMYLAGWVMVFTTVPEDTLDGSAIIKLYRIRWQVELAFKRLKSLLDLDLLRTKRDSLLGKLWITGKLLYAVVIDRHLHKRFGHNWNRLDQVRITTSWRLLKIVRTLIDSWIHEIECWRPANQVACFEVLRERPRRRALQNLPSEAVNWLKLCNKLAANSSMI
jgi:hypothetical protein